MASCREFSTPEVSMFQRSPCLLFTILALSVALVGCQRTSIDQSKTTDTGKSVTLSYSKGQLITLASVINKEGDEANAIRTEYFQRVSPIGRPLGLSSDLVLRVTETTNGDFKPRAFSFFSWPSAEAEAELIEHPEWAEIKRLRPDGWDKLRLYSDVLEENLELTFNTAKHYTVAVAWLNPDAPGAYDRYLDGIEPTLNKIGGRFMYKMRAPRFEQHASPGPAPGQVTIVEWDSLGGLDKLLASKGFKEHTASFQQGVTRFELHRIKPVISNK